MTSAVEIQFDGPSWGHHGPYTFFRSFSYRRPTAADDDASLVRSVGVGQFFFVRILAQLPICIAELQLLWESRRSVGTKLASVKLYFTPDDTPSGRRCHHGQDELLVADEKVVLEVSDLVKWIVDSPVTWPYGFQMPLGHQQQQQEEEEEEVSMATEKVAADIRESSRLSRNGFKQNDVDDGPVRSRHDDTIVVVVVSYAQYCRYRALAKRLEGATVAWMQHVVVMAMSGIPVARGDARLMFCRDAFAHPELMFHDFRRDRLAPKLKGRKRRRKLSRLDSMESVDSDPGQERSSVAMTTEDGEPQRTKAMKRFKGLTMPSSGLDLISSGKEAFEQHLFKFMRDRKTPIKRIPSLGFKEVDLFQFFIYSQKFGGYDKVTEGRHWKQIYDQMGGHPGNTSAATCTRRIYEKLLLTFERHVRYEEDKPLPVTYMRPARKKLRELATMRDQHVTLVVSHDQPCAAEVAPAPSDDPSTRCGAMATGDRKVSEVTEVTSDVTASGSAEVIAAVSVKVDVSGGQSLLADGQLEIQSKFKSKRSEVTGGQRSPPVNDFKNASLKDRIVPESSDAVLAPSGVADPATGQKVNSALVSRTLTSSRLSLDQTPTVIRADNSLPKTLPLIGYPLPFVAGGAFVSPHLTPTVAGTLEGLPNKDGAASAAAAAAGVPVATATASSSLASNPSVVADQKPNPVALAPFGFHPPKIILNPPTPGSIARSPVPRPTYGPPNLLTPLTPLTPTTNGLLLPLFEAKGSSALCRPVSADELQKPSTANRRESTSADKAPPPVKPNASPSRSGPPASPGAWFNSPIKQFLDRTRAMTSSSSDVIRSHEAHDQPIDLSLKSSIGQQKSAAAQSARNSELGSTGGCARLEQDEPLNLSKRHESPRESGRCCPKAANLVPPPSTKKAGGGGGGGSPCEVGRVVLPPKSDLIIPLILSVPSPVSILAQSNPAAVNCVHSLSVAPSIVANSLPPPGNKMIPTSNGLLPTSTILSSSPFPPSLVGAALRPVFQFFPSHPLASNIAYASETGRPLLLRFPVPAPLPPPPQPTTTTQAPHPPPSLVASKGNRS